MTEPVLGIDIAKLKFNVCLININGKLKHKVFPNTSTGFEQLLESLIEMRVVEENRLSSGITVDMVRQSVEELLAHLNEQIKRTEELIRTHINSHPTLKRQSQLLDSIPGIAQTTAA